MIKLKEVKLDVSCLMDRCCRHWAPRCDKFNRHRNTVEFLIGWFKEFLFVNVAAKRNRPDFFQQWTRVSVLHRASGAPAATVALPWRRATDTACKVSTLPGNHCFTTPEHKVALVFTLINRKQPFNKDVIINSLLRYYSASPSFLHLWQKQPRETAQLPNIIQIKRRCSRSGARWDRGNRIRLLEWIK